MKGKREEIKESKNLAYFICGWSLKELYDWGSSSIMPRVRFGGGGNSSMLSDLSSPGGSGGNIAAPVNSRNADDDGADDYGMFGWDSHAFMIMVARWQ